MGSQATQLPSGSSATAAAAATYPQWMVLAPYGGGNGEGCNITGDSKTIAAAITSGGHRIVVSLRREPSSPARSRICLCFLPGPRTRSLPAAYSTVLAAHGGSVLVQITSSAEYSRGPSAFDYFVYNNAGAGDPARLPSLHLLPSPRRHPSATEECRLDVSATGFLCRGEADFVVAQLKMPEAKDGGAEEEEARPPRPTTAELLLFRNGEWRVTHPPVVHYCCGTSHGDLLLASWEPRAVVPLGDGVLCWVGFSRGVVVFSDVFDDRTPRVLWYVPYPVEATTKDGYYFVCTNPRGELKVVGVSPRRCSHCGCSQHATAVDTWTLNTDDMVWVRETEASKVDDDDDSTELWVLARNNQSSIAHDHLVYPVASMNGGGHGVSGES